MESNAILLVDCETHRFMDVNLSAQRLYGYHREEFLQLTVEAVSDEVAKTRALIGSGNQTIPLRWHRKNMASASVWKSPSTSSRTKAAAWNWPRSGTLPPGSTSWTCWAKPRSSFWRRNASPVSVPLWWNFQRANGRGPKCWATFLASLTLVWLGR